MRVLMLGWEFPPYISGGLGTACYGLTRALSRQHVNVTFVLPKAVGTDYSTHVKLLSPQSPEAAQGRRRPEDVATTFKPDLSRGESFDVVHAHDWLTFPAGMAVAAATGKPLVVQVHSTEFDRAGENIHQQIYDIERAGLHAADRVVAVSHLTASILQNRYAVAPEKIDVVYNGIENGPPAAPAPGSARIRKNDKIVLFLGRITMQKGPEYFVAAAKRVLEKVDKVKFVMAGAGDKVAEVIDLAARQGLGHKILFTGFLRGPEVSQIFRMADVYVMPSVSEPFGIATLEAISHDVPVIISKQSGVAEVLEHALKVDFWDTDEMANKIIAVLRHPPLASTLRQHADIEVRKLTWDGAATKLRQVYAAAVAGTPAPAPIA